MITLVVGGTLREAANWAHREGLHRREVRLGSPWAIRRFEGLIFDRCVIVGSFWQRRDAQKVRDMLDWMKLKRSVEVNVEDLTGYQEEDQHGPDQQR